MRTEIAGAQITTSVAYVIEILQTCPDIRDRYIEVIDSITRREILNDDRTDGLDDFDVMSDLRVLQQLRNDIMTIATPPDLNDPENDIPAATI